MTLTPTNIIYGTRGSALVDMWWTSYQNMKHQFSLRRRVITGGSEMVARVSRRMDCRIGAIEFYVSANNEIKHVTLIMCQVCGFICYFCVELKLKINTRSRSYKALKWEHPSLRNCRCWPSGVFQLMTGEPRPRYSALQLLGESGACGFTRPSFSAPGNPQPHIIAFNTKVV